jgi:hypothetical protein
MGFQHSDPIVPPSEALLWRVTKDTCNAQAVVRLLPHGRELRVTVNGDLMWSRLFRDDEDGHELGRMSDGCRVNFERVGWTRNLTGN